MSSNTKQLEPYATTETLRFSKRQKSLMLWIYGKEIRGETLEDYRDESGSTFHPIEWSTKDFLGKIPTPSESSTISRTLSSLEARGMVKLTFVDSNSCKRRRTSKVALTRSGRVIAEALAQNHMVQRTVTTGPSFTQEDYRTWISHQIAVRLINEKLGQVTEALNGSPEDIASFKIIGTRGTIAQTPQELRAYQTFLEQSLTIQKRSEVVLSNKLKEIFLLFGAVRHEV